MSQNTAASVYAPIFEQLEQLKQRLNDIEKAIQEIKEGGSE